MIKTHGIYRLIQYNESKALSLQLCLDCGIPTHTGVNLSSVGRWDAIGIGRRMKLGCVENCKQSGSMLYVCLPDGKWESDTKCGIWSFR
jgi:hypothetical protein